MKSAIIISIALIGACYGFSIAQNPEAGEKCDTLNELVPDPVDCTIFYQCGPALVLIEVSCPLGTYYSASNKTCLFPIDVPECSGGTRPPAVTTTVRPPTTAEPETTTEEPDTTTTRNTTQSTTTTTTPQPTTTTEEEFTTTEEPETPTPEPETTTEAETTEAVTDGPTTTGPETTTSSPICTEGGVYTRPFPGNCSLYYLCTNYQATIRQCGEGTFYDPVAGWCNAESQVPLCSFCKEDEIDLKPVAGNCSIFLICAFGETTVGFCPEGTLFDPVIEECNVADNVNCTAAAHSFLGKRRFF